MANLALVALALLLTGCFGRVESSPDGITGVAWCECVQYRADCGQPVAAECIALTDPEQLNASWWWCVKEVAHSGPLDQAGRCELPALPRLLPREQLVELQAP